MAEIKNYTMNFGPQHRGARRAAPGARKTVDGNASLAKLEEQHGRLPRTYTQHTPTGGIHYYRLPEGVQVPNSAGRIGPALDIRGLNGYIVAAGSVVAAGEYLANSAKIAPAPQWLVKLAGKPAEREERPAAPVAEGLEADVQRAIDFLKARKPAVQGEAGDAWTYATVCRVRDMGVDAATALDLLVEHFNPRCQPVWERAELERKVENAYRYATGAQGADANLTNGR